MADNIISEIREQASMLPGHRVKWKKRGVSVTDTFTHEGMIVQVTYDTGYRALSDPPGVRSWVTSIRLRHPDLDLQDGWSESGLGYSTRFLSKRCSDLAEYATIYRLLEAAGLRASCKTYLPVVAGTGAESTPWHSVTTALKLSLPVALRMKMLPVRRMLA